MKVVDAGVVIELVAGRLTPDVLGDEELAAPHLLDSEVVHALRGKVLRGRLSDHEGVTALRTFTRLTITRHPADWLRLRMWELRNRPGLTSRPIQVTATAPSATKQSRITGDR